MISSNELRKGNLFHPIAQAEGIKLPGTGVMFEVVELLVFKCRAVIRNQNPAQVEEWTEFDYSEMSPVLLTPNILERAGFEENKFEGIVNEYKKYCSNSYYQFDIFLNQDNNCCVHYLLRAFSRHPQYLHQLQNSIFVLSGEELTVE